MKIITQSFFLFSFDLTPNHQNLLQWGAAFGKLANWRSLHEQDKTQWWDFRPEEATGELLPAA